MSNNKKIITPKEIFLLFIALAILISFLVFSFLTGATFEKKNSEFKIVKVSNDKSLSISIVIPTAGVVLPIVWKDLGKQMIETGVIDQDKFEALYTQRGGLSTEEKQLLYGDNNGKLKIDKQNANFILNLLWAFGLGNKNAVLEEGSMQDSRYGGAGNFASTGGWTISKGNAMNHYSRHPFVVLTKEQQDLVERVSKNIYRPCCGNSTYFPDCNHGMAMLGLLELMASQGVDENGMYKVALQVNSFWFPSTYLSIAKYFETQGVAWEDVDAKEVLGFDYSSAKGSQNIRSKIETQENQDGGGGCGV